MKAMMLTAVAILFAAHACAQDLYNPDYSTYMALKYVNELQVDQAVIDQIASDRTVIETAYPEVSQLAQSQDWNPGHIVVGLSDAGWAAFTAGGLQELRDTAANNGCYVAATHYDIKALSYASLVPLHAGLLADQFDGVEGVRFSAPDVIGLGGSSIEVLELGAVSRYLYTAAWNCTPMGCTAKHYWEFAISGGEVLSVSESGTVPAASESWGDVKALYR